MPYFTHIYIHGDEVHLKVYSTLALAIYRSCRRCLCSRCLLCDRIRFHLYANAKCALYAFILYIY